MHESSLEKACHTPPLPRLVPSPRFDCPRCFAQCEALRRTASVLNTHGYCICLVVCGGPAPAAARRPPPQAGAEPPARPELVLHGLRAFARRARARSRWFRGHVRRPSAHWRWRRSLSHCAAPPRCMACSHTRRASPVYFPRTAVIFSGHAHEPRNIIRSRPPRCAGDGRGGTRARRPGVPDGRTRAHAFLSETVSQLSHVLFCDDPLVEIRSA